MPALGAVIPLIAEEQPDFIHEFASSLFFLRLFPSGLIIDVLGYFDLSDNCPIMTLFGGVTT